MVIKGFRWPDKAFDDALGGGEEYSPLLKKGCKKARVSTRNEGWLLEKLRLELGAALQGQAWGMILGLLHLEGRDGKRL